MSMPTRLSKDSLTGSSCGAKLHQSLVLSKRPVKLIQRMKIAQID